MGPVTSSPASSSDLYSMSESDDPHSSSLPSAKPRSGSPNGSNLVPYDTSADTVTPLAPTSEDMDMSSGMDSSDPDTVISKDSKHAEDTCNGTHKRKRAQDPDNGLPSSNRIPLAMAKDLTNSLGNVEFGNGDLRPIIHGSRHPGKNDRGMDTTRSLDYLSGFSNGAVIQQGRASIMPTEIWQHIFSYVPPVFLGRLLRVDRAFNAILTPITSPKTNDKPKTTGALKALSPDSIWMASRKRFCPGLPRPLRGFTELEMWRLLRGNDCQICGERKSLLTTFDSTNPWQCGPGSDGVCVIWPFGIRCCGTCMKTCSEKEVTLLFSSTFPSFLIPALSYAFVSQSDNLVASMALRSVAPPPEVQLTKHYYKPHIEEIKRQFDHVKDLGSASAEEWIKGLDSEGKARSSDAARWEQWEAKGGLKKVNARPNGRSAVPPMKQLPQIGIDQVKVADLSFGQATHSMPSTCARTGQEVSSLGEPLLVPNSSAVIQSTLTIPAPSRDGLPQRPPTNSQQARLGRSLRDVNEAKAARRAEIERRCLTLDPPLEPSVLHHMESFQAAIQISTMLTDNAWDVLKPRLLAQRESAQRREDERIHQGKMLQAKSDERRQQDAQLKEAKETLDKEWDAAQSPIRHKLAAYADEIIENTWSKPNSITKDTCPKFAADVLMYARRRFYDEIANQDAVRIAAGESITADSLNGPPTRKLILENMKWLFDNKIKSFTENFQKELFLCNGCDGNFKLYGFEGVIQHYAAKHTTSLSMGSVVVHWRSEWPEHPPFHPNPSAAKAAYYAIPMPLSAIAHAPNSRPSQAPSIYSEYVQGTVAGPQVGSHAYDVPQFSPGPYHVQYQNDSYQVPYSVPPTNMHYATQGGIQGQHMSFPDGHGQYPPTTSSIAAPGNLNGYPGYTGFHGAVTYQPSAPYPNHAYPNYTQHYRPVEVAPAPLLRTDYVQSQPYNFPPTATPPFTAPIETGKGFSVPGADLYQIQMNEMAKHARDVWFGTSGIKDIPQSVRIFVVIHHVASRFAQKYTNEPSLSMFLDGLDHSALMRPVRSLNGLACRTCVTDGSGQSAGTYPHTQAAIGDRKLYTLPHLLNHFRTAHMEKTNSVVIGQPGQDEARPDWKRDMVELPESPLIADLVNAPGMDDKKLELIAWVFPGVFLNPLPKISHGNNIGPMPKHKGNRRTASVGRKYTQGIPVEVPKSDSFDWERRTDEPSYPRPYSGLRPSSPSTARASEPPGEDEYDPHRPAYLGRIVQSRTTIGPVRKRTRLSSIRDEHPNTDDLQHDGRLHCNNQEPRVNLHTTQTDYDYEEDYGRSRGTLTSVRAGHGTGSRAGDGYHENLDRFKYNSSMEHEPNRPRRIDHPYTVSNAESAEQYVSEDGEVNEEPLVGDFRRFSRSPIAARSAAEKFLSEFNPSLDPGRRAHSFVAEHHGTIQEPPQKQGADGDIAFLTGRDDDVNMDTGSRALTTHVDPLETRDSEYASCLQTGNDYAQPDAHIPIPRVEYLSTRNSADRHRNHIYTPYGHTRSTIPQDEMDGNVIDQPRSRYHSSQGVKILHHRERSRSPQPIAAQTAGYRARSPFSTSRREQTYKVSSSPTQRDYLPQRPIYYDGPPVQEEYTFIRDPARRVEYIPVKPEEYGTGQPSRYVLAQPGEHREPADPVRLIRGYEGEQAYDQEAHLYYSEPRLYESRRTRDSLPSPSEYSDYRRQLLQ